MEQTQTERDERTSAIEEIQRDEHSRKRFFKMVGGAGAASAFAIFLAACGDDDEESADTGTGSSGQGETQTTGTQADSGDLEIVNYALTLEYLEADFYQQVIDSGEVKDKKIAEAAKKIGENEQEHVDTLKATVEQMGGTPAEQPKTKFEDVIAGGPKSILSAAAMVENLGAAAYLGQADKIQNPDILAAALSIHTVEARHAAALNFLAGNKLTGKGLKGVLPDGAFAKPMSMEEVLKEVQPFIAS